ATNESYTVTNPLNVPPTTVNGVIYSPQYIWVDIGSAPILFTTGSDSVNFNSLTPDQQQAIANGADITHGLGGNDVVTLPNSGTATFYTDSTVADNNYRVIGGSGTYNIFEGAGTEFITINGNGGSTITVGSGADTITINGTGTNNVLAIIKN